MSSGMQLATWGYKYDFVAAFFLSCLLYGNTYNAGLLYDDETAILRNRCVVDKRSTLSDVFNTDFWGYPLHMVGSHKSYRPITTLTFRMQVQYVNGDSNLPTSLHETYVRPNGMRLHVVNIVLFAFVSAVFCIVLHCMFPFPQYTSRDKTAIRLAVLLFVVHPVHTEVVANIVGRCELLSTLFMLFSFIAYLKCTSSMFYRANSFDNSTDSGVTDSKDAPTNTSELTLSATACACLWYALSVVFILLATLSKEQGITGIGLWFVIDVMRVAQHLEAHMDEKNGSVLWHTATAVFKHRRLCMSFFLRQILNTLVLATVVYYRIRMNVHLPVFSPLENPVLHVPNMYTRVLTYSYINACNLGFFVFPWNLTVDWSAGYPLKFVTTIFDWRMVLPLSCVILILCLLADIVFGKGILLSTAKDRACSLFGLSVMIITFVPSSNMFFPVGFIWAERVLFAPSLGFSLLGGYALSFFIGKSRGRNESKKDAEDTSESRKRSPLLAILILSALSARTVARNNDWYDEYRLYQSAVETLPSNPRNHHGLATYYSHYEDKLDKAEKHFLKAISLDSRFAEPMNSLGILYQNTNRTLDAIKMFKRATVAGPGLHRSFINLGDLLLESAHIMPTLNNSGEYESLLQAEDAYVEATRLPTVVADSRYRLLVRLGILRMRIGKFIQAADAFEQAVAVKGVTDATALNALATMHIAAGRFDDGIRMYKRVIDKALNTPQHLKNNEVYNVAVENIKKLGENTKENFRASVRMSFCNKLIPSVRKTIERMPLDGIMEEDIVPLKKEVLLVFEDQSIEEVTERFCHNNLFNSHQCNNLIENLKTERKKLQVEKGNKPLGEVRYNVVIDNREELKFSMDGKEITLEISPDDNPEELSNPICKEYSMRSEDCPVLTNAVAEKRDISLSAIKQRYDRNPFNLRFGICNEQASAEAMEIYNMLENKNPRTVTSPMEKRRLLRKYGNLTFGVLGKIYYENGRRAAKESNYEFARTYIRYAIFYSAFLISDMGEDESKSRIGLEFGGMITDALKLNNHLKKYTNPIGIWKEAIELAKKTKVPDPSRIAIVSLCQYDPEKTPLGMLSIHNKVIYQKQHGYRLYVESKTPDPSRPIAWGKIKLMQKYLDMGRAQNSLDWVVWVDCDSFFMNTKLKLNLLLSDAMTNNKDLIISEDGMMLNTGFFAVRTRSEWARTLLEEVYDDESDPLHSTSKMESTTGVDQPNTHMVFTWHPWWEQASMMFLLHHMDQDEKEKHVKYFPQRVFNSYPKEYSNKVHNHFTKRKDLPAKGDDASVEDDIDFVIAFSGCKTYISEEECNSLYEEYSRQVET